MSTDRGKPEVLNRKPVPVLLYSSHLSPDWTGGSAATRWPLSARDTMGQPCQCAQLRKASSLCSLYIPLRYSSYSLTRGPGWLSRYSDSLRVGRSGSRIPVGGGTISVPVQTGPGDHQAPYTIGIGSFPGVMRPGRGFDHPPPSSTQVKERVEP